MQNQTTPRQNNIRSLINSIRTIANDVYREVGSNPQDPSFSIQPTQSQPNDSNIHSSMIQPPQKPALTMSQTPINLANPSSEIGVLFQRIQKGHAKVDEVIRTVPKEVHDQVLGGQTKSLNDLARDPASSSQNLQTRETVSHSVQDIASFRFTSSNPFAKNAANGAYTVTASTPYLNPPMAGENLKTSVYESQTIQAQAPLRTSYVPLNGYALPQSRGPFTKNENNMYQSVSLNDIPNSSEPTDENRPKSLLHASNYFKSTKKNNAYQTPLQEKYKQFFPQQSTSSRQSENPQKVQDFGQISTIKKAPENPNQHVEKILDRLRYQEERHKRQRMEEDYQYFEEDQYFEENQYFEEENPTIGKNEAGRRRAQTQRRASRDSRKLVGSTTDLQEEAPSIVLSNDVSEEQSVRANSRQDIERRIEQLGKESRKTGPKKVIPSLGGGQLVIEKKQSSDLDRNTQVFGKETSSGGNMARQGLQKRRNLTKRDRNPHEFMVKKPASSGQRRQRETDDEFDFEENSGDGEAEQQFYGQRSEKGNRSQSRSSRKINNGDMVWSSHKKSKRMLENIVF